MDAERPSSIRVEFVRAEEMRVDYERCSAIRPGGQCGNNGRWIVRQHAEPPETFVYSCGECLSSMVEHVASGSDDMVTLVWPAAWGP